MNKLILWVILGIILVTVGGILLAYSTYQNYSYGVYNQFYSLLIVVFGFICVFAGAITFILSLTLLFIAVYKDRNISQKPKK